MRKSYKVIEIKPDGRIDCIGQVELDDFSREQVTERMTWILAWEPGEVEIIQLTTDRDQVARVTIEDDESQYILTVCTVEAYTRLA